MSITLNVIYTVHEFRMVMSQNGLGVIQIYYFQNGPNATVTSQIISTPNFIALY